MIIYIFKSCWWLVTHTPYIITTSSPDVAMPGLSYTHCYTSSTMWLHSLQGQKYIIGESNSNFTLAISNMILIWKEDVLGPAWYH